MRQTSCKHCGHDIEGASRDWRDRGSQLHCPEFCGYDEDGTAVYRIRQRHVPVPLIYDAATFANFPTRRRPLYPFSPRLTQPRYR